MDDDALERGLADGTLAVDTRVRDALRLLRGSNGRFGIPTDGVASAPSFSMPEVAERAVYAGEASTLVEIDGIVRAEKRVEALEARVDALRHLRRLAPR